MKIIRYSVGTLLLLVTVSAVGRLDADQAPCVTVSTGAETDALTGSLQNVGQTVIGRADNGVVFMHAGALACLTTASVPCLLGDVNNDGLIDGLDIQPFALVKITGIGTLQELCASNIDVPDFVALLLSQ
ncbi:MAG: hypothetical protein MI923_25980 [Phycisphaerales bacterium]|nr:hypothetical protein [Phycisphaerales bacterium]